MSKYENLITIIDKICLEAPPTYKRYHPEPNDSENLEHARARAFIHLFLKVKFGLIAFLERETLVTDDTNDGGIDGYYIDKENKKLYFIQSKFRATERNFETKEITFAEILSMDVERISKGETCYENGIKYNDKIQNLIKELQEISDIPKYDFKIILLANIKDTLQSKINKIIGGFHPDIYNYERSYNELVFPLISGTYYNISELKITINLDSTNSGHRIDYNVKTESDECNVNAFFVPTLEIAKIVSKYKNSILKYNPRSYLDLVTGSVNAAIASSIREKSTNEFALFNNGITMLSNNTKHSDKVGKKNQAEVIVTNPQIINGGQTAYTLSRIYDECIGKETTLDVFNNKEVLLKIITFSDDNEQTTEATKKRISLIEKISRATNQQSPVTEADRRANDEVQIKLQEVIFREFGLYYERKRGEFGDGLRDGYISKDEIVDRELFLRVCLAVQNKPHESQQGQHILFAPSKFKSILVNVDDSYRKYMFAYYTYIQIPQAKTNNIGYASSWGKFAVTKIVSEKYSPQIKTEEFKSFIANEIELVLGKWMEFQSFVVNKWCNIKYFRKVFDKTTGNPIIEANWGAYFKSTTLVTDIRKFFNK
jgi:hypothetical protein